MPKRYRVPQAKPGELRACYGKPDRFDRPDLCYVWGGPPAERSDGRVLSVAIEGLPVFEGKNLRQELEARGYDITTLRFSVRKQSRI